ncbi:MAG: diguanylate cyclase [Acidobacteria bacterium]|nr:diguanylate cyclase [Acidobacteriota bacterium]
MTKQTPSAHVSADPKPRGSFRSQPPVVRAYVSIVVVAGAVVVVAGAAVVAFSFAKGLPGALATFVGLLAVSVLTSAIKISLPLAAGGSSLSFSYVANFASVLVLGTWPTVLISAVTGWSQCTFRMHSRNPVHKTLFSIATLALSAAGAGVAYQLALPPLVHSWWTQIGAAATAASAYFLINTSLVSLAVSLTSREPVLPVWQKNFLWSAPSYYIGAGLAMVIAQLSESGLQWWAVIFSLPVYLTYRSFRAYSDRIADEQRQVRELADVQLATIEALALAIEAKDRTSHDHLRRMQAYSEGLGRAIGLTEPEIRGIKTAAMLHDIGNLAVPEHILSKTGTLSDEEYSRLKIHPRVGAEIIRSVPFPYPVASLILSHHERWDGRGYPEGLKGHEIPAGARILAVADCFTAMLSGRPHRPARTYAEAIATLRENGGSALDPTLVERFIEVLPDVEYQLHGGKSLTDASRTTSKTAGTDRALTDIAGAHREEQMLHDISQALSASLRVSDTLALVSSSMVECVPFVSCALFLFDEESQLYLCRHVAGTQHDGIRAMVAAQVESLGEMLPAQPIQGRTPGTPGTRIQSALVSPLQIEDQTIGALALYHTDRDAFTADHRRLLGRVAAQAATVIANAMVFERAQEQSLTDVLTGLPNRRYLDRQFGQELARAQRQQGRLSLLVLDMDRFKQINDGFGHQAGDRALKEVAHVLRSSLRVYDVCARFAGDEFVVVLGDCEPAQAERRRQELQSAIAALPFEPAPGHVLQLGVSIGVASFPEDGQTVDEMVAIADRRMYADKANRKSTPVGGQDITPGHLWP